MKTTENISLAGYAFTIETDAYEELGAYLSDLRPCYSGDASADAIVADIEERVAELLRERCISGMVVDLTMVRDIKKRIGNPKELAQEDTESSFETSDKAQDQPPECGGCEDGCYQLLFSVECTPFTYGFGNV